MTQTLGRIKAERDGQCGPDVMLDIVVEREWLRDARTIEIDLPRHLCCAACQGAGCDICAQSGALTVRGRSELAEIVRVTLPRQEADSLDGADSSRAFTLKVPGCGAMPDSESGVATRGRLMLRIKTNGPISNCIRAIAASEPAQPGSAADSAVVSRHDDPGQQTPHSPMDHRAISAKSPGQVNRSDESLSQTSRSTLASELPVTAAAASGVPERKRRAATATVEPSIGWTWRDTFIGLALLVLGALIAWWFVQPS